MIGVSNLAAAKSPKENSKAKKLYSVGHCGRTFVEHSITEPEMVGLNPAVP